MTKLLICLLVCLFVFAKGTPGILSFQTCLLYQRKLSSDDAKEGSRGTRDYHMSLANPSMRSLQ